MIEDGIDHFLVAVDDLQQPLGCASFDEEFGKANGHAGIAFGRLEDEGVARRDRHAEHPHRDHRRKIERSDARADTQRLAHRINVDAGACALRVFALERLRNAARIFDDFKPALHIAMRIVHDLAMFAGKQLGKLLLVFFNQSLEFEHDTGALLRIGRGPFGLDLLGSRNRLIKQGSIAQRNFGLNLARRRVPDLVLAGGSRAVAGNEMVNLTHRKNPLFRWQRPIRGRGPKSTGIG